MTVGELFTALGWLTGGVVFLLTARQRRLATDGMSIVAAWGFFAAVLGAKLTEWAAEGFPAGIGDPRSGGRALLGGIVFGWIGVEGAKLRLGIRRSTGDLFALALPAGEAVGRIGCYFNGCCYGTECDLPWAIWQHGAWRHPAQLYSSAVSVLIVFSLILLKSRLSREGDLFRCYLVLFGITRFLLEFVRWRESLVFGLSPMQWFCLELVAGASIWWYALSRRRKVAV